jgi:hypothetical protein
VSAIKNLLIFQRFLLRKSKIVNQKSAIANKQSSIFNHLTTFTAFFALKVQKINPFAATAKIDANASSNTKRLGTD